MKAGKIKTLKIYWESARQHKISLSLMILGNLMFSIIAVIVPLYFKKIFDLFSTAGANIANSADLALQILLIIGILEVTRWGVGRVMVFATIFFQTRVICDLSNYCFRYIQKHSFSYFNNNFVGSMVKRFNWFTRAFEGLSDKINWDILPLIIKLTAIIYILFQRSPIISFSMLGWAAVFMTFNLLFTRYKLKFDTKRNKAESKSTGILADTITNHSNVKLFNGYEREIKNYGSSNEEVRRLRKLTWDLDAVFDGIQVLLAIALELGIFYIAIVLWSRGQLTIGDFVLLQSYIVIVFNEIWGIGKVIRHMFTDLTDAEEMTEMLSTPHDIQDIPRAKNLKVTAGKIEFINVKFNYHETRSIISKLNLSIPAGQKVALVGPSGAGKTTIVKIILRLYDIDSGKILVDGQDIAKVKQESLWKNISLVPQDPILFHRTLRENIRYGRPEATDAEVERAAKLAHCHEFISNFPEKYDTFVGERGVKLSGGERQRVAIARTILRNSPILLLDEATSSLDSESESLIQDALSNLIKNKTVIVIAHRLSTIMKMDRIIVLDKGAVVENGTHRELLKQKNGLYQQLWKLQAGGFIQ